VNVLHTRLSILCATALIASPLLAQTPSPPPALDRQWLAGTWKLDRSGPPEDRTAWTQPSTQPGVRPQDIYEFYRIGSLRGFEQKLMIESEALVISIGPDAIIINDDFREPTRYTTNQDTSIRVVTGSGQTTQPGYVFKNMNVRVKTS
jgi:hypothetical protein